MSYLIETRTFAVFPQANLSFFDLVFTTLGLTMVGVDIGFCSDLQLVLTDTQQTTHVCSHCRSTPPPSLLSYFSHGSLAGGPSRPFDLELPDLIHEEVVIPIDVIFSGLVECPLAS